jgi:hypothetical protein
MHVAEPNRSEGVYSTLAAMQNLISGINESARLAKATGSYEEIVSAFPLGNVVVVITESRYT